MIGYFVCTNVALPLVQIFIALILHKSLFNVALVKSSQHQIVAAELWCASARR